jgi:hypothetical protein
MGTPFSWPTGFPPRSIKGVLPGVRILRSLIAEDSKSAQFTKEEKGILINEVNHLN